MTKAREAVTFQQAVLKLRAMLRSVEYDIEHEEEPSSLHAHRLLGERDGYTFALQVCIQEQQTLRRDLWKQLQGVLDPTEVRLSVWPAVIQSTPTTWYSDHFTATQCSVFVTSRRVVCSASGGGQYEAVPLSMIQTIRTEVPYGRLVLGFQKGDLEAPSELRFDLMPWTGEPERFVTALHDAWLGVRRG